MRSFLGSSPLFQCSRRSPGCKRERFDRLCLSIETWSTQRQRVSCEESSKFWTLEAAPFEYVATFSLIESATYRNTFGEAICVHNEGPAQFREVEAFSLYQTIFFPSDVHATSLYQGD